jgi:hypothetical protein
VNKIELRIPRTNQGLSIPIMLNWDLLDTENEIVEVENEIQAQIAGLGIDFETDRFSHSGFTDPVTSQIRTDVNYEFYFFSGQTLQDVQNTNSWNLDYRSEGFSTQDIYYFTNRFTKSFFKLDFYDSTAAASQTNYLTIIIPTTQGLKSPTLMQGKLVDIQTPKFSLDFVGNSVGFFIYWLKSRTYIDLTTFYMSCKFYNASTGSFTRMINRPQSLQNNNNFTANQIFNFYYQVNLNYPTQTYSIYDTISFDRVGTNTPIKWYEYVDPNA